MREAITIEDLCKYYNGFLALDHLSLRIAEDEDVGLLGPNGAGKTTTMKILCGLISPSSGRAYIYGDDVVEEREKALRHVGAIVEAPEFYPYLTPEEVLSYLGRLRGMSGRTLSEAIAEALGRVKLEDWAKVKIGKFSRGMKQRLAIAQALLHDPPVLILDEPALGLDPRGMVEVREMLKEVRERRTVFYASHILSEVTQVCDKVAIIHHGRLLAYDSIENLRRKFESKLKIEVETVKPLTARQLKRIEGLDDVVKVERVGNKVLIEFEGSREASGRLMEEIRRMGHQLLSFRTVGPTLEDVYLKLVGETV
ncbi:MAG: ABC transporter ATP-binding protein [Candidatus Hadarchaeales archaeon]